MWKRFFVFLPLGITIADYYFGETIYRKLDDE